MALPVTVIGCGVIGLTSAIRLQENGFEVTIISRDLPPNLTSAVAGAYWYGGELAFHSARHRWSTESLKEYLRLAKENYCGVSTFRMLEVFGAKVSDPWFKDLIPSYERVKTADLPSGYADGYWMEIPIVETPRYLNYLVDRFQQGGGQIQHRTIADLAELANDHPLIVNCTGVYARFVAHDAQVYPLRGQVIKIDAPHIKNAFNDDDAFTYILPRRDGCVLGGVSQRDNWNLNIDTSDSEDIWRRCEKAIPGIRQSPVIAELVGLRPGRYQVRLESETLTENCTVIHNYGHGGIGYTLSWGCALDVVELVKQAITK
ncbi:MAG: FAD-dependent oxidoreductase [Anaerolineaceae bacterium]|nr:FAD-dependent oxidoreductase [Anaerolineaceae bacterium]